MKGSDRNSSTTTEGGGWLTESEQSRSSRRLPAPQSTRRQAAFPPSPSVHAAHMGLDMRLSAPKRPESSALLHPPHMAVTYLHLVADVSDEGRQRAGCLRRAECEGVDSLEPAGVPALPAQTVAGDSVTGRLFRRRRLYRESRVWSCRYLTRVAGVLRHVVGAVVL